MAKRKGIGPRQRFDIFKRDQFTCRYCGKRPPEVTLEVDHIVPVCLAGENHDLNLITSCRECNAGKGAESLSVVPSAVSERLQERKIAAQQLAELERFLQEERRARNEEIDIVDLCFHEDSGYVFTPWARKQVDQFLNKLAPSEVREAAQIAHDAAHVRDADRFRYFCGVCWRKIRGD